MPVDVAVSMVSCRLCSATPLSYEVAGPTDEVLERSAQSVEPPDDEGVAGTKQFLDLVEPRAGRDGATDLIDNHLVAAGALERVALQVGILLEGRHPSIADFHGWPFGKITRTPGAFLDVVFLTE